MWFQLAGDERIAQRCASEDCGGQPTWRLESGGIGSNYCSGCKSKIDARKVIVRAGIRDAMIADMARALEVLANWPTTAAEHEYPDDVAGAQEYAEMALRRYREAHKRL
jgi:hypothetical protein